MKKGFVLHVRDFGKLKTVDINVAPVTFFVGDNNSGKSYLMALLYSLLNMRLFRQEYDLCVESKEYQRCQSWIEENFSLASESPNIRELDDDTQLCFQELLNLILMQNREKLMLSTFNSSVKIGEISIEFPKRNNCVTKFYSKTWEDDEESGHLYQLFLKIGNKTYTSSRAPKVNTPFFICAILEFLLKADFKTELLKPACFLPTSRTGFLLTYKSLLQATITDAYDLHDENMSRTELTRPCTDFLKNLATVSLDNKNDKFQPIIEFIENHMIGGHISVSQEAPQATVRYRPSHAEYDLPMQLTSGVVTELTPLILMLQHHSEMKVLFMEEPEMGLHPGLQLKMAQVLLRIYSTGMPIFVTTHSDTILQHINNMLKLGSLDKELQQSIMEELGYIPEDLIPADEIEMYQFNGDNFSQKSTVEKLEKGPYGFIVPSFNDVLRELLSISLRMEPDDDV